MKKEARILIVDDNEDILTALRLLLSPHYNEIITLSDPKYIHDRISTGLFDVYILDMNYSTGINSGNEGIFWMNEIIRTDPNAIILMLTAYATVELAVRSLQEGATDFIQKPWEDDRLIATVHSAYSLRKSKLEVNNLKIKQLHLNKRIEEPVKKIVGVSAVMEQLIKTIRKVAPTDASILILGESGTGKELLAREIHRLSERSCELFVDVDSGAIPENLFESEMFGYVKGAFTDAKEEKAGKIEVASGGTLFLDEIGNMPPGIQPKLLRVLQSRQITRLGSSIPVKTDIRLISATNSNPAEMISMGLLREDLFYRLNTIQITIPPLRERVDDIPVLAALFLNEYGKKYNKPFLSLSSKGLKALMNYSYPGNVRELEHMIEKAVILSEGSDIGPEDICINGITHKTRTESSILNLEYNEKKLIIMALQNNNYNQSRACKELGISRKTLYNKILKYDIQ